MGAQKGSPHTVRHIFNFYSVLPFTCFVDFLRNPYCFTPNCLGPNSVKLSRDNIMSV